MNGKASMPEGVMRGICHIYFETGYEGSCLAFQDERHISKIPPRYGVRDNETVWDSEDPKLRGKTRDDAKVFHNGKWYPLPDPIQKDPDYFKSSLYCGESHGDREADKRLMDKYGFIIKYASDRMDERYGKGNWRLESLSVAITPEGRVHYGGTPSTEPDRPYSVRSGELTRVTVEWKDGLVESRISDFLLVASFSYEGLHILKSGDELTVYDKNDPSQVVWTGIIQLCEGKNPGCPIQKRLDPKTWKKWFIDEYPALLIKLR